jgi:hypothetical protein
MKTGKAFDGAGAFPPEPLAQLGAAPDSGLSHSRTDCCFTYRRSSAFIGGSHAFDLRFAALSNFATR